MKLHRLPMLLAAACIASGTCYAQAPSSQPPKYALLIGISTYSHPAEQISKPGSPDLQVGRYQLDMTYDDLAGPPKDVQAMRDLLTGTKFGFPNDDAHIRVLKQEEATHDGIMAAMQKFLVDDRKPGDTAVLFISSHGSLRVYGPKDGPADGQLYSLLKDPADLRHVENTIVPYDWNTGADDIFSRDFRHIFLQAARKQVDVTAIFDSCHSGTLSRGLGVTRTVAKDMEFDPRPMPKNPYPAEEADPKNYPQLAKDHPTLILSAAQKDQKAADDPTDPPHGVFTRALVESLAALPPNRSADDVFERVRLAMELDSNSLHPQPEIDASAERRRRPIFGGAAGTGPAIAGVVSIDPIVLDLGTVADIGPGSTFKAITARNGRFATIEVTESQGPARSIAKLTSTDGATVQPLDVFQLQVGVPWGRPPLLFYAGASNPAQADLQESVAAVLAANLKLAADPSRDAWTQHLAWNGTGWALYAHSTPGHAKAADPINLGPKLSAAGLRRIPAGAVVWFDPPLSREATQALLPPPSNGAPSVAAKIVPDRSQATYVVGSRASDAAIEYAWFKRSDVDGEVLTPPGLGAGCSPGSSYPLRTDYSGKSTPEQALNLFAGQLARLNGWFHLQSSAIQNQHEPFPYDLALRRADGTEIRTGGTTTADAYTLELIANAPLDNPTPRWVYVLGIDCQGKGSVVWPYDGMPPAKFPSADKGDHTHIPLPGLPFPVQPPFGTDSYILLSTSTPLANYAALDFDGVVTRSAAAVSPLEALLDSASAGVTTRSGNPIPTDWSIQRVQVQSRPVATPTATGLAAKIIHLEADKQEAPPTDRGRGGDPSWEVKQQVEIAEKDNEIAELKRQLEELKSDSRGTGKRPVAPPTLPSGKYQALVIGIDQYPGHPLHTAVADARQVAHILEQNYGFTVDLLLDRDATKEAILNKIAHYVYSMAEQDNLLIYFAGHGQTDKRTERAYWAPVNATFGGGESLPSWILSDELTSFVRAAVPNHVLVVSDSCYSGDLISDPDHPSITAGAEPTDVLGKMLNNVSRTLMTSGGDEPVADRGNAGHSVFAFSFLQALQDRHEPSFSAYRLYGSVWTRVTRDPNAAQVPQYFHFRGDVHDHGGDFIFQRQTN